VAISAGAASFGESGDDVVPEPEVAEHLLRVLPEGRCRPGGHLGRAVEGDGAVHRAHLAVARIVDLEKHVVGLHLLVCRDVVEVGHHAERNVVLAEDGFPVREVVLRDDRGDLNDTVMINGEKVVHPINQEVVTIRGIISGEYIVNLHYYQSQSKQPVTASVKIEKVNPVLRLVFIDQVLLEQVDDEKTVLRFELDGEGEIVAMNRLDKILTPYRLDPEQLMQNSGQGI